MKRILLLSVSLLVLGAMYAQVQTIHNPDLKTNLTQDEITQWGKTHQSSERSSIIQLTFEGLGDLDPINNFYNGGTSGFGNSGPNYGVQFGVALGIIGGAEGGTGNFSNEPSPRTIMFFLDANAAYMNYAAGFTTGFSFFYSANTSDGYVSVYDGLNGTGTQLATLSLPWNANLNCPPNSYGYYCHWDPVGVSFSGTAKSIVFGGSANFIGFDNVTFGSDTPIVPTVPVSNWALYLGLGLIVIFTIYRFSKIIRG